MNEAYLEVTFRQGHPLAAYYYLPRRPGEKSQRTSRVAAGIIVDLSKDCRPIGIEITAPSKLNLAAMNRVLRKLWFASLNRAYLAPVGCLCNPRKHPRN